MKCNDCSSLFVMPYREPIFTEVQVLGVIGTRKVIVGYNMLCPGCKSSAIRLIGKPPDSPQ